MIEVIENYKLLLNNYSKHYYLNLHTKINSKIYYFNYIYYKGLYIIKNIYSILYLYINNISDIYNITEKAYIYFIEFINQLNFNNYENNLELTLRDAILFCYRKTLFNNMTSINNINTNTIEKNNIVTINKFFNIINILHLVLINNTITDCIIKDYTDTNQLCIDGHLYTNAYGHETDVPNTDAHEKDIVNIKCIFKNNFSKISNIVNKLFFLYKKYTSNNIIYLNNFENFINYIYNLDHHKYLKSHSDNDTNNYYKNLYNVVEKFINKKKYLEYNQYDFLCKNIMNNDIY